MSRAFTDFYSDHGAHLVSRSYDDVKILFKAREALFVSLGLPPSFLADRSILEFGPGTGHYSVFNFLQRPSKYHFVEGVPEASLALRQRLANYQDNDVQWFVEDTLFEQFHTDDKYDVVIAESCIPHQKNPSKLFSRFAEFVLPGGVLIITTASGASHLSETLRRLIRDKLIHPTEPAEQQLDIMVPIIAGHLENLKGVSRTADDWVLDNIIQPLGEVELFSIAQAIDSVTDDFSVLGTAPKMIQDWSWHRTLSDPADHSRRNAKKQYYSNICGLLDLRYPNLTVEAEMGEQLENECHKLWYAMGALERQRDPNWSSVLGRLQELERVLLEIKSPTVDALKEVVDFLKSDSKDSTRMRHFPHWWGVGQQHIAFYRNSYIFDVKSAR